MNWKQFVGFIGFIDRLTVQAKSFQDTPIKAVHRSWVSCDL